MKIKKIFSLILAVLMLISSIPIVFAETTEKGTENYNLHKDLIYYYQQPVGDKEISSLANKLNSFSVDTDTIYVDNEGVRYTIKGDKGVFTVKSIVLPENMKTYTLPATVTIHYFVGSKDSASSGSFVSEVEKNEYSWDMPVGVIFCTQTFSIKSIDTKILNGLYCEKLVLSNNIGAIPDKAFSSNTVIKEIYAPQVMNIGANAFSYCMNLRKVYIPRAVNVKDQAFIGCSSLTEYDFRPVQSIGKNAFKDCSSLIHVELPQNLTYLNEGAFSGCTSIQSVDIPAGIKVNTLPKSCFMSCTNLKEITLPYEIIIISESAFSGCANLKVINFVETNISTIGKNAFFGCLRLETAYLPQSLVSVVPTSFESCPNLRFVYFDSSLTDSQKTSFDKAGFGEKIVTEKDNKAPVINIKDGDKLVVAPEKITCPPTTLTITDNLDVVNVTVLYNGNEIKATSRIMKINSYATMVWDVPLTEDGEYKITATDAVGNKTVKIFNYKNSEIIITKEDVSVKLDEYYEELPVYPPVTITKNGSVLELDKHYTIEYKDADKVGKAQIIIKALEPYKGEVVINYEIKELPPVLGDVNGDKKVTASDARLVLRMSAMLEPYDDTIIPIADVTGDGEISASDARKILRISAMLE